MSSRDLINMGIRNLLKRKLRTFLTVLGVMIGTASIVVMVSLGLAINEQFAASIDEMGDMTLIQVYNWGGGRSYRVMGGGGGVMTVSDGSSGEIQAPELDDKMIESFEEIPGVVVATPILNGNLFFKSGSYYLDSYNMYGLKPEAMAALGYIPAEGRLLESTDGKLDVVFGGHAEKHFMEINSTTWYNRYYEFMSGTEVETFVDVMRDRIRMSPDRRFIWNEEDPSVEIDPEDINAPRPIKPYDLNVVGVLEPVGDYNFADEAVFMEIGALQEWLDEAEKAQGEEQQEWGWFSAIDGSEDRRTYDQAYVKCEDLEATKKVYKQITEMGFQANYPGAQIDQLQQTMGMLQMLLAAIGGVSLFVAAIGIANTMVMSIYERTREIGVMKVIGASIRDIKWLFLLESALIGLFGGIFGIGISYLISYALNNLDIPFLRSLMPMGGGEGSSVSLITPWLCGVSLGFSSAVGLFSGYFPARRATKLSALTAIRTE